MNIPLSDILLHIQTFLIVLTLVFVAYLGARLGWWVVKLPFRFVGWVAGIGRAKRDRRKRIETSIQRTKDRRYEARERLPSCDDIKECEECGHSAFTLKRTHMYSIPTEDGYGDIYDATEIYGGRILGKTCSNCGHQHDTLSLSDPIVIEREKNIDRNPEPEDDPCPEDYTPVPTKYDLERAISDLFRTYRAVFNEYHPNDPHKPKGTMWVKDDTPSVPMYTDDKGDICKLKVGSLIDPTGMLFKDKPVHPGARPNQEKVELRACTRVPDTVEELEKNPPKQIDPWTHVYTEPFDGKWIDPESSMGKRIARIKKEYRRTFRIPNGTLKKDAYAAMGLNVPAPKECDEIDHRTKIELKDCISNPSPNVLEYEKVLNATPKGEEPTMNVYCDHLGVYRWSPSWNELSDREIQEVQTLIALLKDRTYGQDKDFENKVIKNIHDAKPGRLLTRDELALSILEDGIIFADGGKTMLNGKTKQPISDEMLRATGLIATFSIWKDGKLDALHLRLGDEPKPF